MSYIKIVILEVLSQIFYRIHSIRTLSYDRFIASPKAGPPPSAMSTKLSFSESHVVAAYVFFLVFPSLLHFFLSVLQ
jgi:hypothetical protein